MADPANRTSPNWRHMLYVVTQRAASCVTLLSPQITQSTLTPHKRSTTANIAVVCLSVGLLDVESVPLRPPSLALLKGTRYSFVAWLGSRALLVVLATAKSHYIVLLLSSLWQAAGLSAGLLGFLKRSWQEMHYSRNIYSGRCLAVRWRYICHHALWM